MTDMVSTLDLSPGTTVQRIGTTGLLRVSEVREPSHPLMPGLVVTGHYWRADERRYNDRETALNIVDITRPEWYAWPDDALPTLPDERYDVPDGMVAWRYGAEITIRQFRQWATTVPFVHTRREINTAARRIDATARKASNSMFGTEFREIHECRYVITSNVTVADPDESMPVYDGPADAMAEHLSPGTYTDLDGREWTVTSPSGSASGR